MPSDFKKHALELVDRLFANVQDFHDEQAGEQQTSDLRAAIEQLSPGREWRRLSEAPKEELLRVLVERTDDGSRFTINARLFAKGWWNCDQGNWLNADLRPLAWKPADSTELPEGFGE